MSNYGNACYLLATTCPFAQGVTHPLRDKQMIFDLLSKDLANRVILLLPPAFFIVYSQSLFIKSNLNYSSARPQLCPTLFLCKHDQKSPLISLQNCLACLPVFTNCALEMNKTCHKWIPPTPSHSSTSLSLLPFLSFLCFSAPRLTFCLCRNKRIRVILL